jgi:hypothetical protein
MTIEILRSDAVKRLTTILVIAGLGILTILFIGIGISRLIYPFDVGHYEAFIWTPSRMIISGENPYAYATRPPFIMAPYGAFYYVVIGVGIKLFGLQLWFGRLVSLTATMVCLACLGRLTFILTRSWRAVSLALVAFLATFPLQAWIAVQRPDLPSLALALSGLVLVVTFDDDKDRITPRSFAIVLLFAAAYFTKQTTLIPVLIGSTHYWLKGRRRSALFVLFGTVLLCLAVMVLLDRSSGPNGYFWQHFAYALQLPITYKRGVDLAVNLLLMPSSLVFLGIMVFLSHRLRSVIFEDGLYYSFPRLLVGIYLFVAAAQAVTFSARYGASINYYLEAMLIGSLAVALAWDRLRLTGYLQQWFYPVAIGLLTAAGSYQLARVAHGEYFRWKALPYYEEVVATLGTSVPPNSLCISVYPELVTRSGHEYHFDDFGEYTDGWSLELKELYQSALRSGRYAAIIRHGTDESYSIPGYHRVLMNTQPPSKFHNVSLYVRNPDKHGFARERANRTSDDGQ